MNISQILFRLQVHGHQVRRQLRLQSGLQVRLQKRPQGSVLQDQVVPANNPMDLYIINISKDIIPILHLP